MSKLVEKWRKVLDASEPVIDEENAAIFLEEIQQYFLKRGDKALSRGPTIFIPAFRRLLSSVKMHYDSSYKTDTPLGCYWSHDLSEDLRSGKMNGIDIDAELVNVMTLDLEQQLKRISTDLIVNFELDDYNFKIYAKPYEE